MAGLIYWLHGFNGYLSRDLSLYAYAGQQQADGVPPYLAVVNRSGPLSHLVPGIGAWLGRLVGADDVRAERVFFLLLAAASIWVAYLLGRDLLSNRLVGLAMAMALLYVNGFTQYASDGPREKTTMVLCMLLASLALVHRRFFWSGFFVSLATLTWQPAFFGGVVAALAGLWVLPRGTRLRGFWRITLGGLLPLAVFIVWYAAIGHLHAFLECFVLIHVGYTHQPGLYSDFGAVLGSLRDAYGISLVTLAVGSVSILAFTAWTLFSAERRALPQRRMEAAFGISFVAGLIWSTWVFNGWPDLFFMLPSILLGVGLISHEVTLRLPGRAALSVVLVWAVLATVGAVAYAVNTRNNLLLVQRANVHAVLAALPGKATIVSIEGPQPLVLSGSTDPFRHQMFSAGLADYVDHSYPGGLVGLRDDIGARHPTVISVGTMHTEPWIMPLLNRDYRNVGGGPGWTWWIAKSVGAKALAAATEAAAAHGR